MSRTPPPLRTNSSPALPRTLPVTADARASEKPFRTCSRICGSDPSAAARTPPSHRLADTRQRLLDGLGHCLSNLRRQLIACLIQFGLQKTRT